MMIFVLLLALPPILIILYFQTQKPKSHKNLYPPGPPGLPFIGNLHQFDGKFPNAYFHNLAKQYGPIISLKLGFRKLVVISSADVVKQIIKSYDLEFSSRPVLVGLQRLSYNGLDIAFSPYNDTWREMRKIGMIHLFSAKQLQFSRPILKDEVAKMIKKISLDASLARVSNLTEMIICGGSCILIQSQIRLLLPNGGGVKTLVQYRGRGWLRELGGGRSRRQSSDAAAPTWSGGAAPIFKL